MKLFVVLAVTATLIIILAVFSIATTKESHKGVR